VLINNSCPRSLATHFEPGHLHARNFQQITDQPIHPADLPFDDPGGPSDGGCIQRFLLQQRCGVLDGYERMAKFVRNERNQLVVGAVRNGSGGFHE
jgi:hypothetical protein